MEKVKTIQDLMKTASIGKCNKEDYKVGIPFHEVMGDGIYRGMFNGCMVARKRILSYENGRFPLVADGDEGYELIIPKIPFKYWQMIWSFYRDVNTYHHAEASVLVYWNTRELDLKKEIPSHLLEEYGDGLLIDGQLILYVPKQRNYATLTEYNGDEMRIWLGENTSNFLDTHSHNTMSAFFSGTDDANEKLFQFYSVFGRIGIENTCIMRYRFQNTWEEIDVFEVFEDGEIPEGNGEEVLSTYPIRWWNNAYFPFSKEETDIKDDIEEEN